MENGVSQAAKVIISVIPIVGIVMGAAVIFFYLLWSHREKMLMIKNGSYNPRPVDIETYSLFAGVLLVSVGLVLSLVFLILGSTGYNLLGGLVPLSIGAGCLLFYRLYTKKTGR